MKANHSEEFLDRTLKFGVGFGALNDGDSLAPKQARENGAILLNFPCLSPNLTTLYLM